MLTSFAHEMVNVIPIYSQIHDFAHTMIETEIFMENESKKFMLAQVAPVDPLHVDSAPVDSVSKLQTFESGYGGYSKSSLHFMVWTAFFHCLAPFAVFNTLAKEA